jgi:hypothetical protein
MTPFLKKSSRLPVLKHTWGTHYHHWIILLLLDFLFASEIVNMFVVEWIYGFFVEFLLDFLA